MTRLLAIYIKNFSINVGNFVYRENIHLFANIYENVQIEINKNIPIYPGKAMCKSHP